MTKSKLQPKVTTLLLVYLASNPGWGQDVSGSLSIMSDYMFRGVSQTLSGPALQGDLVLEHESGLYGFVWASNVTFTDDPAQADGASMELNYGSGMNVPLNDRMNLDIGISAYAYPDLNPSFDYDYTEWHSRLSLDERHSITFAYAGDVFGSGLTGKAIELETTWDTFNENIAVHFLIGHVDLRDGHNMTYRYGEIGLSGYLGKMTMDLDYCFTNGTREQIFSNSTTTDRLVFSLGFQF